MISEAAALQMLIDKEAIRELVLLYSRSIDRKDVTLLQSLYTPEATDRHGKDYDGDAAGYCAFIARSLPYMRYSGHHVCNHLVSVQGNRAEGEVYAIACHVIPDGAAGWTEDLRLVRYLDRYQKNGGTWRFAQRVVTYDYISQRPASMGDNAIGDAVADPSYSLLASRLFLRGARSVASE